MNKYFIDGVANGAGNVTVIAAKMLITSSGVAIFKDFQGENFLVVADYTTIELVEKNIKDEDEEDDEEDNE